MNLKLSEAFEPDYQNSLWNEPKQLLLLGFQAGLPEPLLSLCPLPTAHAVSKCFFARPSKEQWSAESP